MDDPDNDLSVALQRYRRFYEERERSTPNYDADAARKAVAKALRLAKSSGLAQALIELMEETKHWHAWSKRPDFSTTLHFMAEDVTAIKEPSDNFSGKVSSTFTYKSYRYGMAFNDKGISSYGDVFHHGEVEFLADGEIVLGLDIADDMNPDYSRWHEFNIYAFRAGEWMGHLLEMSVDIRNARGRSLSDRRDADAIKRASAIRF